MALNARRESPAPTADVPALEGEDPDLRAAVERAVTWPLWVALVVVALPFALGLSVPLWVQYLPLVASALLLGMPHGALDHLVPAWLSSASKKASVASVVGLYAVVGGGYLALWFLAPLLAVVAFVCLTWAHWGQGDLYPLAVVSGGEYPRSDGHRLLVGLARGAFPMLVPLVAFPDQYRRVVADLVGLFGADTGALAPLFARPSRVAVAALVLSLASAPLLRGALERSGREWRLALDRWLRIDLVETLVLSWFFLVVPPILAVGLYFCLWHSGRHLLRVAATTPNGRRALRDGRPLASLASLAWDAAPTTGIALALVGLLAVAVPTTPGGLGDGVAVYLVAIAGLTLPHVLVVSWMDYRQGLWSAGGDR